MPRGLAAKTTALIDASAAILARLDPDRWQRAEMVERAELQSLGDFLATWPGAA